MRYNPIIRIGSLLVAAASLVAMSVFVPPAGASLPVDHVFVSCYGAAIQVGDPALVRFVEVTATGKLSSSVDVAAAGRASWAVRDHVREIAVAVIRDSRPSFRRVVQCNK